MPNNVVGRAYGAPWAQEAHVPRPVAQPAGAVGRAVLEHAKNAERPGLPAEPNRWQRPGRPGDTERVGHQPERQARRGQHNTGVHAQDARRIRVLGPHAQLARHDRTKVGVPQRQPDPPARRLSVRQQHQTVHIGPVEKPFGNRE